MSQQKLVPGFDYSTAEGLQRKRLLAFVNRFLSRTIDSLVVFSKACDSKLLSIAARLKKLENALVLLETKLDSVPELRETKPLPKVSETQQPASKNIQLQSETHQGSQVVTEVQKEETESKPVAEPVNHRLDPTYAPYLKMVEVGVPLQAVRLKMQILGLDDSVLDRKS